MDIDGAGQGMPMGRGDILDPAQVDTIVHVPELVDIRLVYFYFDLVRYVRIQSWYVCHVTRLRSKISRMLRDASREVAVGSR